MKKLLFQYLEVSGFVMTLFFMVFFISRVEVRAEVSDECRVACVTSVSDIKTLPAGYTASVSASGEDRNGIASHFVFTLQEDSWLYISGNYSDYSHDGAGTHVDFYYDSAMSRRAGSFGWGYWQYDNEFTGFLPQGTYYSAAVTKKENFRGDFHGNINITAAAVPVSDMFRFTIRLSKNRKNASVSISDSLGSFVKNVQYRSGYLGLEHADSRKYWKKRLMDDYYSSEPEDAALIFADNGKYQFKAFSNGCYTVMVEDRSGSRYSSVVEVSGIDDRRPVVSGVADQKTYKKPVIIVFHDKQSGIRSAKLNGKNIASGEKVSRYGTYKLSVTDKAGNKTIIRFHLKR